MARRKILLAFFLTANLLVHAQRNYKANSVLASGNWYKISVDKAGIYKIDIAFLAKLGINTANISSASIRLFGNGGAMLPEDNKTAINDDLVENSIQVIDGGDGLFNGNDYILFYAPGPDRWLPDSSRTVYLHQKNLYTDQSFYYLQVGGTGKRITNKSAAGVPNITVNTYDFNYAHEVDSINFLKSGKEWFGEEFSNTPGNDVVKTFTINTAVLDVASPVVFSLSVVARSIGAASRFNVSMNGQQLAPVNIAAVSGNFLEGFANEGKLQQSVRLSNGNSGINLQMSFSPGSFNAQAWLNRFTISAKAMLQVPPSGQLIFSNAEPVGNGNIARYTIQNAVNGLQVWDISNQTAPVNMQGSLAGNIYTFVAGAETFRSYILFTGSNYNTPVAVGSIAPQNLHNSNPTDLIIITNPLLLAEANRLADFRRSRGIKVTVATTTQVYNEFASGNPDPTALRNYVKMFYDRAGTDTTNRPKYLLLFGDASFDYKSRINNNTNLVPGYESQNSLQPLQTYTSDDFFGFLDDGDDINNDQPAPLLDIGIGRIPAGNTAQAKVMVNKIIQYEQPASFGAWRNQLTFVADDEDANLHLQDAEFIAAGADSTNSIFNQNKIYLDAFKQESGSGGSRYPAVNNAIVDKMNNGNLVWNYTGHGGSQRLADEAILDRDVIRLFNNPGRLPLFVTATCDFAPFDDPTQASIGEDLLLANENGAIALTTTTRLVFAYSNKVMNDNFLKAVLSPVNNHLLGDALRQSKNLTYLSGDVINNRKFTLLGDPAMRLAIPQYKVNVTHINDKPVTGADTLKALDKYSIKGVLTDNTGMLMNDFNGTVYLSLYSAPQTQQTLGNDAGSTIATFTQQGNLVYKGKVSVTAGNFIATFIIPKDVNYLPGKGKMSWYADNGKIDANGAYTNFKIGGTGSGSINDKQGPEIKAYLNDEKFVNGGLVNESPVLIVQLTDSSGMNTSGTAIGHDLIAVLDGNDKKVMVLNDFYEADLNSFQKGTVRFPLAALENGNHSLKIKAWDVANNSAEQTIEFVVAKQQDLQLEHVFNYPNPFTTHTNFWFEHNQPASNLNVLIQIFSLSGKLVHQIQQIINTPGNRCNDIEWDGKDEYGQKLGRGVYIYKVSVTAPNGKRVQKTEKLYLL